MKLDKPAPGARSISLAEFIQCLKTSSQIEEELTSAVSILSYLNVRLRSLSAVSEGVRASLRSCKIMPKTDCDYQQFDSQRVKEIWLATLSFDIAPDLVTEDDKNLEVTLSELEEIITRCVLQRSKVAEDHLPQQTDLFLKKFMRSNL